MRTHVQSLTVAAAVIVAAAGSAGRAQTADKHQPGIYLATPGASGETLVRLRGSTPDFKTKGMMKMMLTQGLSRGSFEADLAGPVADIRTPAGAVTFYFYFDPDAGQPNASMDPIAAMSAMSGDAMPPQARSAGDFALIELKTSDDKRIADMGKMGSTRPKNAVAVTVERLAQGAYKLQPKEPLRPGEYAFCFVSGTGPGGVLWDFGVDAGNTK
ncbi:MAG: hypothetical protein ACM3SQ_07580 [Betaproteobacteria bacterium]